MRVTGRKLNKQAAVRRDATIDKKFDKGYNDVLAGQTFGNAAKILTKDVVNTTPEEREMARKQRKARFGR